MTGWKDSEYISATTIILITIALAIIVYLRFFDLNFFVGPYRLTHWFTWIGTAFIAIFAPIFYVAKRKYPLKTKSFLRVHVFGSLFSFMLITILLGLIYLSMSTCFSAILTRHTTSLYAGIALFFWSMIIASVIMGIHLGSGGSFADFTGGTMPDWIWISMMLLSPMDMSQTAIFLGFDLRIAEVSGFSIVVPDFITMSNLLIIFIIWIIVPLSIGYYFYKKRDI